MIYSVIRSLRPNQFVNQFPCENVVTCKDLLVEVARRAGHGPTLPPWFPVSFNLLYELPRMVREFLTRKERLESVCWLAAMCL